MDNSDQFKSEIRAMKQIVKKTKILSRSSLRWLIERLQADLARAPPDPPIGALATAEPEDPLK